MKWPRWSIRLLWMATIWAVSVALMFVVAWLIRLVILP